MRRQKMRDGIRDLKFSNGLLLGYSIQLAYDKLGLLKGFTGSWWFIGSGLAMGVLSIILWMHRNLLMYEK
jgi:hypothetical protein